VPELGMMVKSLAAAARSVSSTFILLAFLMYVFAVIFTQWGKDKPTLNGDTYFDEDANSEVKSTNFFGDMMATFFSLMQILVYDDTFSLIRDTYAEAKHMGLLLIFFIFLGSFTILNMLIGVICEIVSNTKKEEEEKLLMSKIEDLFLEMDLDESGSISREEFGDKIELLEKFGLDQTTIKLAFDLIDADRSGQLEMQEFIHMVFRLLHPPASQDLLCVKRNLARLCEALGCDVFDAPPPPKKTAPRSNTSRPKKKRESGTQSVAGGGADKSSGVCAVDRPEERSGGPSQSVASAAAAGMTKSSTNRVNFTFQKNHSNGNFSNGNMSGDNSNHGSVTQIAGGPSALNDLIRAAVRAELQESAAMGTGAGIGSDLQQLQHFGEADNTKETLARIETAVCHMRDKLQVRKKQSTSLSSLSPDNMASI